MRLCTIAVCVWACVAVLSEARSQDSDRVALGKQRLAAENDRYKTLTSDSRLDSIRDKVALGRAADATLQMMALQSKPTQVEKQALEHWQNIRREARLRYKSIYRQHAPAIIPFEEAEAAAVFSLVVDLYTEKISYGEFNRQRLDVRNRTRDAIRQHQDDLRKQREAAATRQQAQNQQQQLQYEKEVRRQQIAARQARDAEVARQHQIAQQAQNQQNFERAMRLAQLQTYLRHMQLINQQYQPTRIAPFSCTRIGNMVDCY